MKEAIFFDLSDKAEVIRGVTFSKGDSTTEPSEGLVPILRAGNIQTQLILNDGLVYIPDKMVKERQKLRSGDIVMCTSSGSAEIVGKTAFSEQNWNGSFGAFCAVVRPRAEDCHPRYLFHYLQSPEFRHWTRHSAGVGIKNIRKSELDSVKIPFPSFEEQRRIAGILDKADVIRRKREQALILADVFLKSVFIETFGDQAGNPKEYSEVRLDEIAEINSGITKGRKVKPEETLRSVPYMRVANVQDGRFEMGEIKEIEATESEIAKFLLRKGDLLLTEGGDPDKLGRGCVWNDEVPECIHQNHIFRVRLTTDVITPLVLQLQIGSPRGKHYFLKAAKQTTGIASINKRQLSAYPVLIPDAAHQSKYENIANKFAPTVEKLKGSVREAYDLFNSLSQRAFSGKL